MPRRRFKYLLDPVMAVVSVTKYGTAGYELGWLIGMEQNLGSTSLVAQLVKNPPASPGEGKGYPTPVFWPGEFRGLYSPWGCKELDTTE